MHKDLRKIVRELEAKGYTVTRTKGGHYKVKNRDGATVAILPGTPGDSRWLKNTRADLRKKGLID